MNKIQMIPVMTGIVIVGGLMAGCESSSDSGDDSYPKYTDANANSINDYVESDTHRVSSNDPQQHDYLDLNNNQTCDYAEGSNPTWHGPGYIDEDSDGVCDYWDEGMPQHRGDRRDIIHGSDFEEVGYRGGDHH